MIAFFWYSSLENLISWVLRVEQHVSHADIHGFDTPYSHYFVLGCLLLMPKLLQALSE